MDDRHGVPLEIGDKVIVRATFTACRDNPGSHCITLTADLPFNGRPYTLTINSSQVEKVGPSRIKERKERKERKHK